MKLWTGRFHKELDKATNDFNSSISFDSRMAKEDIEGSIAHATMLGECGIIDKEESQKIIEGLEGILSDLSSGALQIDPSAEDIHTFVEGELTSRLGDAGKRLHTARSRNDQVALDVRLYLKKQCDLLYGQLSDLVKVPVSYTHLDVYKRQLYVGRRAKTVCLSSVRRQAALEKLSACSITTCILPSAVKSNGLANRAIVPEASSAPTSPPADKNSMKRSSSRESSNPGCSREIDANTIGMSSPVSYTHLPFQNIHEGLFLHPCRKAYRGRGICICSNRFPQMFPTLLPFGYAPNPRWAPRSKPHYARKLSLAPVSYTHLDVYKRQ